MEPWIKLREVNHLWGKGHWIVWVRVKGTAVSLRRKEGEQEMQKAVLRGISMPGSGSNLVEKVCWWRVNKGQESSR